MLVDESEEQWVALHSILVFLQHAFCKILQFQLVPLHWISGTQLQLGMPYMNRAISKLPLLQSHRLRHSFKRTRIITSFCSIHASVKRKFVLVHIDGKRAWSQLDKASDLPSIYNKTWGSSIDLNYNSVEWPTLHLRVECNSLVNLTDRRY